MADWLLQANSVITRESNWLLFPVVVNFVLEALGYPCKTAEIEFAYKNYYKFKEHYLESGWFFDGQNDRAVDYYNAWGITYDLFWLHLVKPDFDGEFIIVMC